MPVKRKRMSPRPRRRSGGARSWIGPRVGLALCAAALVTQPAAAQQTGRMAGDGFLFRAPIVNLSVRAGFDRATAGSDIFSFATEQLTLDRGSFSSPSLAIDLGVRVAPRVDVVAGVSFAAAVARSESREFEGTDDMPIEQSTNFRRIPITLGARAYLMPRGRSIGRYAWVPAKLAPYVGAGGGVMWHRFQQTGEFVDFQTLDVFPDEYLTSGWTPTAHGMAGLEYSVGGRLALTGEARYTWARASMSDDFKQFDRIDLSGLAATAGIAFRF